MRVQQRRAAAPAFHKDSSGMCRYLWRGTSPGGSCESTFAKFGNVARHRHYIVDWTIFVEPETKSNIRARPFSIETLRCRHGGCPFVNSGAPLSNTRSRRGAFHGAPTGPTNGT